MQFNDPLNLIDDVIDDVIYATSAFKFEYVGVSISSFFVPIL